LIDGYVNSDPPDFLSGDTFDNTIYAAGNLIWNPCKSLDVGVEYLYGRRENKDGATWNLWPYAQFSVLGIRY
jgi:hypothetical protein